MSRLFWQREIEDWRRPKNFNKALGEAQHLIENADLNKVIDINLIECFRC